ncbi:hypothetical protein RJ639_039120 [Escallonia herrerae]|uniref:Uncharacterized protein n=1 Tax=Escallonia herrerae TaxID=1293975 RepID=A0AA88WL02_9ASTE|nr:hypothetical protein RJ639_039120 [Escallonia herrerae]
MEKTLCLDAKIETTASLYTMLKSVVEDSRRMEMKGKARKDQTDHPNNWGDRIPEKIARNSLKENLSNLRTLAPNPTKFTSTRLREELQVLKRAAFPTFKQHFCSAVHMKMVNLATRHFEFVLWMARMSTGCRTYNQESLNSGTIRNGLIWVNALAQLLTIEEILQKLLHLGDSNGTANKDHIVDTTLVHLGIFQTFFNRLHALPKEIHVKLFEPGTSNGHVEINTLKQAID